jgi:SNF2 family DNA or RNA helicase
MPLVGEEDKKLRRLVDELREKVRRPINTGNKKVLIFTAFADTANSLYRFVTKVMQEEFGLHTALVTGSVRRSTSEEIPNEINTILTCFSPRSKEKGLLYPHIEDEIDIMIATDCISEGQNLQDCDYLINYDIHWNPVRITQRFGRIDRIGSINNYITMVNFWPDMELEAYINLKERVEDRMLIGNMAGTGDENLLKVEEAEMEYRKEQLKKLQEQVMDLEDFKQGISITDLGLSDFRVDLANLIKEYGELKNIPEGLHAIAKSSDSFAPGVLFVLRNINEGVNIEKLNRLHPYYLVYLSEDGECIINHIDAKKNLDALRRLCKGYKQPHETLCKALNQSTGGYSRMGKYSSLLQEAISTILNVEEEKDALSIFRPGGTTALAGGVKGMEDFSLVSFIIIK